MTSAVNWERVHSVAHEGENISRGQYGNGDIQKFFAISTVRHSDQSITLRLIVVIINSADCGVAPASHNDEACTPTIYSSIAERQESSRNWSSTPAGRLADIFRAGCGHRKTRLLDSPIFSLY